MKWRLIRLWAWVTRWKATLAWVVNIAVMVLLFALLARESAQRDYELCVNANQGRASIIHFVEGLVGDSDSERAREILDRAHRDFAPRDCPPEPRSLWF